MEKGSANSEAQSRKTLLVCDAQAKMLALRGGDGERSP